ncbi:MULTISPECIES: hypothetical protein [unclassified Endozoicomonas]|uniref:hypothetical protein n=1 Tax=unclassified Endozoicomonas TaxID=2644528 RepID=UPI003BB221D1
MQGILVPGDGKNPSALLVLTNKAKGTCTVKAHARLNLSIHRVQRWQKMKNRYGKINVKGKVTCPVVTETLENLRIA